MQRAAIIALLLIAVCAGGVWLTRDSDSGETAAPAPVAAFHPPAPAVIVEPADVVHHLVVDPVPKRVAPADAQPPAVVGEVAPAEVMPSPFDSADSAELNYAADLLYGRDAGPNEFGAAGEVYERCLRQNPANAACLAGLIAAQTALKTGVAGTRPQPPAPIQDDPKRNRHLDKRGLVDKNARPSHTP